MGTFSLEGLGITEQKKLFVRARETALSLVICDLDYLDLLDVNNSLQLQWRIWGRGPGVGGSGGGGPGAPPPPPLIFRPN